MQVARRLASLPKRTESVYYRGMKSGAFGRGALYALLYVAIFIVLVVVQFPSSGPEVLVSGGVTLRVVPGPEDDDAPRSVELIAAALRLTLGERMPLEYQDSGGQTVRTRPSSWMEVNGGFRVSFDDGGSLTVTVDALGRATWLLVPKRDVSSVILPLAAARGARLLTPADDGSPRLRADDTSYTVSGAQTAGRSGLALVVQRGVVQPLVAAPEEDPAQRDAAMVLAQKPMEPEAWKAVISGWQDTAWAWLSGERLDVASASWADAQGGRTFDEDSFVAYSAEALKRGRPELASALAASVRARHLEKVTWRSVPFAGRTATAMASYEAAGLAAAKEAERLVLARSPELFATPDVIHLLFDRSSYAVAQAAMALAAELDFSGASARDAVRLIQAYLDSRAYLDEGANPLAKLAALADKVLAPAVRRADTGFYLVTGADGSADTLLGLEAARALIELGNALDKAVYVGLGQSIMTSILGAQAADASVPAVFTVRDGAVVASGNRLSAAKIYALVADSPYLPKAVSFFRDLGPGSWAWTCSPSFTLKTEADGLSYLASFPVPYAHYAAVYGVKPFERIQLYGINYNMDPSFENYNASGYLYRREASALYLKLKHKKEAEDIRLFR